MKTQANGGMKAAEVNTKSVHEQGNQRFGQEVIVRTIRHAIFVLAFGLGCLGNSAWGQTSNALAKAPAVVLGQNSKSLPVPVQSLLNDYQTAREKYLAQQQALLEKLKGATAQQRDQIRTQLQADRVAFLAEVAAFRQQLQQEIGALQLKIHNNELNRMINSGQGGGGQGGGGHKGH